MSAPGPPRLLIIGGGIVGASAAYFAHRAGWTVTLIDAAQGRASDVPVALLDPLRGVAGRSDARALAGLQLSWALIAGLQAQGHRVPHEQLGVLRSHLSSGARSKIGANLPPGLPHHWLPPGLDRDLAPHQGAGPPAGETSSLLLPQGGWVVGGALVSALTAASGAQVRRARAVCWDASSVTLEGGERLRGQAVLWCGGSVGVGWLEVHPFPPRPHRGGSVLLLDRPPTRLPVVAGAYLSPAPGLSDTDANDAGPGDAQGGVLGATFEAPTVQPNLSPPPPRSLDWLLGRAAGLWLGSPLQVVGVWSGSRLSGEWTGRQAGGWWALGGLGSKGFLLGPLLARGTVAQILKHHEQAGNGD